MDGVKTRLKKAIRGVLSSPPVRGVLLIPVVKRNFEDVPFIRRLYSVWDRTHPFDRQYGIDTSGFLASEKIHSDKSLVLQINPYGGSQPSIVRKGLAALGNVEEYTLVDYGCGKGRVTVVASEFSFREVIGIELSPTLAATARANAAIVAQRFPARPHITIAEANVIDFRLPPWKLAIFVYHSFGAKILQRAVIKLEEALAGDTPHIFFVYLNPVYSEILDASPAFMRFYAGQIPYDKSELGFGPAKDDAIVIWQSVCGAIAAPHAGADRKVVIIRPRERAGLAD